MTVTERPPGPAQGRPRLSAVRALICVPGLSHGFVKKYLVKKSQMPIRPRGLGLILTSERQDDRDSGMRLLACRSVYIVRLVYLAQLPCVVSLSSTEIPQQTTQRWLSPVQARIKGLHGSVSSTSLTLLPSLPPFPPPSILARVPLKPHCKLRPGQRILLNFVAAGSPAAQNGELQVKKSLKITRARCDGVMLVI